MGPALPRGMDSLQLSLNQVNFEEQTLGEGQGEELHAFGNVVSYDSDFKQGGLPVLAKQLQLQFGELFDVSRFCYNLFEKCSFRL